MDTRCIEGRVQDVPRRVSLVSNRDGIFTISGWTRNGGGGRGKETKRSCFELQMEVWSNEDYESQKFGKEVHLTLYLTVRQVAKIVAGFFAGIIDQRERPLDVFTIIFKILMWRRWRAMSDSCERQALRHYLDPICR
jgi:hypothetical protein